MCPFQCSQERFIIKGSGRGYGAVGHKVAAIIEGIMVALEIELGLVIGGNGRGCDVAAIIIK